MGLIAALNFAEGISFSQNYHNEASFVDLLPLLLWPNLRPKPVTTATTLDSTVTTVDILVTAINSNGLVSVPQVSHPHVLAAVARGLLRLMPNLDITVILMDIMLLDLPLPHLNTEAHKV